MDRLNELAAEKMAEVNKPTEAEDLAADPCGPGGDVILCAGTQLDEAANAVAEIEWAGCAATEAAAHAANLWFSLWGINNSGAFVETVSRTPWQTMVTTREMVSQSVYGAAVNYQVLGTYGRALLIREFMKDCYPTFGE